jgi:glycogen debranching enzyme
MPQPYLHEHLTCVAAPATWLSRSSGQLIDGVDGLYVADRRLLSRLVVTVNGRPPESLSARMTGAATATFTGVLRELGDPIPDPTVLCTRDRTVQPNGGTETITVVNRSRADIPAVVEVDVAADFAVMGAVKAGSPASAEVSLAGGPPHLAEALSWRAPDGASATLTASPRADEIGPGGHLAWRITVPARTSWSVTLRITRVDAPPATTRSRPSLLAVAADDRRLDALVRASVRDLDALRMRDGDDLYYAAGTPWFLTLFGRDALWSARLALPLGTEVAAGTLRALARRQGDRYDLASEQAPGKIVHEIRPPDAAYWLPPLYYGSVDSTALFVSTLADAYRWGMPAAEVVPLLSNVERALAWLTGHDGFVTYLPAGLGLTNQGWKDSRDGVQYADGRIASAPLALCEVQGYAYQAALDGAWLLETLGTADGDRWRSWAKALAERFRAAFWCVDDANPYPAIALDARGERVDGPASNMGHLLATGMLDEQECAQIAHWLSAAELAAPFGLRTLATTAAGYNPLSYHAGTVWPHDTVIAVLGLARTGQHAAAAQHIGALLDAAHRFDYRLPELYGGDGGPTPYPPACRPQAWAAAVGPALLTALLGLTADVPDGQLVLRPIVPSPVGAFRVSGLRIAGGELDVSVDTRGQVAVHSRPSGLQVSVPSATP